MSSTGTWVRHGRTVVLTDPRERAVAWPAVSQETSPYRTYDPPPPPSARSAQRAAHAVRAADRALARLAGLHLRALEDLRRAYALSEGDPRAVRPAADAVARIQQAQQRVRLQRSEDQRVVDAARPRAGEVQSEVDARRLFAKLLPVLKRTPPAQQPGLYKRWAEQMDRRAGWESYPVPTCRPGTSCFSNKLGNRLLVLDGKGGVFLGTDIKDPAQLRPVGSGYDPVWSGLRRL